MSTQSDADRVRRLDAELRTLADIGPGDRLEPIGVANLPVRPVGLGASATEALVGPALAAWATRWPEARAITFQIPPDLMARAAEAAQPWERTSPGAGRVLLAGKLPLEIQTFEHSPMIVVLQRIEGEIFLLEGEAGITDWVRGALLVNLGVGRVIVQVVAADREVVIVGEPSTLAGSAGAVTAFRVHRDAPRARAPRRAEVPATPVVDTSAWLGEIEACEPWLRDHVTRLAGAPAAVDRVASAGLLARFAVRSGDVESGERDVPGLVRAWARALDPAVIEPIEVAAAARAEALVGELGALQARAIDHPDEVGPLALRILHARDDLASVLYVVDAAREGVVLREGPLRSALAAFDRVAAAHLSDFAFAEHLESDERILALSWREPDAWWGAFAEP